MTYYDAELTGQTQDVIDLIQNSTKNEEIIKNFLESQAHVT